MRSGYVWRQRSARDQGNLVPVKLRIDTPIKIDYYRHGGILPFVLRHCCRASLRDVIAMAASDTDALQKLAFMDRNRGTVGNEC
jgi:hypothetical protein